MLHRDTSTRLIGISIVFALVMSLLTGVRPALAAGSPSTSPWLTFLAGNDQSGANSVAADGSGNVYVTGWSLASWGSPVLAYTPATTTWIATATTPITTIASPGEVAFVGKLDSNGNLLWNTFIGGNSGSSGLGIAVDGKGNIYVTGTSASTWGSPVRAYTSGVDGFVAKLDTNGNLTWNTFLGSEAATAQGPGITTDAAGNIYVTGTSLATWGAPLRGYTAGNDAFAAKLNSNGALQWNTFLGGSGSDWGNGVALDNNGNIYVDGASTSTWGSPILAYSQASSTHENAFVAKLDSGGNLTWNTFLGGGYDYGSGIALDGNGNVCVAGVSMDGWGSPLQAWVSGMKVFVAKLNSSGGLQWNTFFGSGSDNSSGIALDASGNIFALGWSALTWGSPVRAFTTSTSNGGGDAFVVKLNSSGSLQWNTFVGGPGPDTGSGIAVDSNGNIDVAGRSMAAWGNPVRSFTLSTGKENAFVAKLSSDGSMNITPGNTSTVATSPTISTSPSSTTSPPTTTVATPAQPTSTIPISTAAIAAQSTVKNSTVARGSSWAIAAIAVVAIVALLGFLFFGMRRRIKKP